MAESNGQDMENTEQNKAQTTQILQQKTETAPKQTVKTRKNLFNTLNVVLETSKEKFNKQKASNTDRQRWARIIISACAAYGDLLKDVELESIEERLSRLERQQEKQVLEKFR
jgi:hypothetical protein